MIDFIKRLFEPKYIEVKIKRTRSLVEKEKIVRENLKVIHKTCPECGHFRTREEIMDGIGMITDGKHNYINAWCEECGAEWEIKYLNQKYWKQ